VYGCASIPLQILVVAATLLVNLIDLLLRLLLALVQVGQHNVAGIADHPQLEANGRNTHLHDAVVVVRLVVLVLPCSLYI